MAMCDMCGKDTTLVTAQIEGTNLSVCKSCASYGKIVRRPKPISKKRYDRPQKEEKIEKIIANYASIIKTKRESMGLKQKEFAKVLAEKESLIHKIESGNLKPSLTLARKMEKQLHLKLIEEMKMEKVELKKTDAGFTIGDMIKTK